MRSGKTIDLIRRAVATGGVIIVSNKEAAKFITDTAKKMGVRKPNILISKRSPAMTLTIKQ